MPVSQLALRESQLTYTLVAVIDGSGTIYDPEGLDRGELVRLAKARIMVNNFDRTKLTKDGYLVLVEDRDVTLPSELSSSLLLLFSTETDTPLSI